MIINMSSLACNFWPLKNHWNLKLKHIQGENEWLLNIFTVVGGRRYELHKSHVFSILLATLMESQKARFEGELKEQMLHLYIQAPDISRNKREEAYVPTTSTIAVLVTVRKPCVTEQV